MKLITLDNAYDFWYKFKKDQTENKIYKNYFVTFCRNLKIEHNASFLNFMLTSKNFGMFIDYLKLNLNFKII